MLVLSRKKDESIVIGEVMTIKVLSIDRDKVRLGIDGPKEVSINRQEVHDAIQREQQ